MKKVISAIVSIAIALVSSAFGSGANKNVVKKWQHKGVKKVDENKTKIHNLNKTKIIKVNKQRVIKKRVGPGPIA